MFLGTREMSEWEQRTADTDWMRWCKEDNEGLFAEDMECF